MIQFIVEYWRDGEEPINMRKLMSLSEADWVAKDGASSRTIFILEPCRLALGVGGIVHSSLLCFSSLLICSLLHALVKVMNLPWGLDSLLI
ncbi:hypothetical protein LIER_38657 [Lithospermum erythrorhizon]|uniref:Uncharacterized protein n=1 Tax=Lithospermum erythrorhizon TaxID=34254 RepID=A0AAV3Q8C6_LITER